MTFEGLLEERCERFEDQSMAKPRRFHKAFDFTRQASIAGHNLNQKYSGLTTSIQSPTVPEGNGAKPAKFREPGANVSELATLQPNASIFDERQTPDAIPLNLKQMMFVIERLLGLGGEHRLKGERQHGSIPVFAHPGPD